MRRRWPWLLALAALGCGSSKTPAAAPGADAALPAPDAPPPDAAPAAVCTPACGPGTFCGPASKTCVSAVKVVSGGTVHTCAVHQDGSVSCWGSGAFIGPGL